MRIEQSASASGQSLPSGWPESCLAIAGLIALGYCGFTQLEARAAMGSAKAATQAASRHSASKDSSGIVDTGELLGTISIPELHLSAPITGGVTTIELIRGVGHIPGSAFPGGLGTMGLAGHRDTFFRALRRVNAGMLVRVTGASGAFRYQVDSTEVVTPEQVNVLDIDSQPQLVLITCFPFDYIGAAPKRFIVHAHLLSAAPDDEPQPK